VKVVVTSIHLILALTLSACGGGGGGGSSNKADVDVTALDGYLYNAEACLDFDDDGECDTSSLLTDQQGKVSFDDSDIPDNYVVIVTAIAGQTIDMDRPDTVLDYGYTLKSLPGNPVANPFSTLMYAMLDGDYSTQNKTAVNEALEVMLSIADEDLPLAGDYLANGFEGLERDQVAALGRALAAMLANEEGELTADSAFELVEYAFFLLESVIEPSVFIGPNSLTDRATDFSKVLFGRDAEGNVMPVSGGEEVGCSLRPDGLFNPKYIDMEFVTPTSPSNSFVDVVSVDICGGRGFAVDRDIVCPYIDLNDVEGFRADQTGVAPNGIIEFDRARTLNPFDQRVCSGGILADVRNIPQPVNVGQVVSLNGILVGYLDNPFSYQWRQLSGPSVMVFNAGKAAAKFVVPQVDIDPVYNEAEQRFEADFVFELVVETSAGSQRIEVSFVAVNPSCSDVRVQLGLYDGECTFNIFPNSPSPFDPIDIDWQPFPVASSTPVIISLDPVIYPNQPIVYNPSALEPINYGPSSGSVIVTTGGYHKSSERSSTN